MGADNGPSRGVADGVAATRANTGRASDPLGTAARQALRVAPGRTSDEHAVLTVREADYDGTFGTPKTEGVRRIPLSASALRLLGQWKTHAKNTQTR